MTFATMITAPVAARLLPTRGPRVLMTGGPLIAAAGMLWLTFITADGSYWTEVFGGLVVVGIGIAFVIIPVQNVALAGVGHHDSRRGVGPGQLRHADRWMCGPVGVHHDLPRRRRTVRRGRPGRGAALTEGYSAVFLATAVTLVVAAVVAATMLRGPRPAATPQQLAEVPVHVG